MCAISPSMMMMCVHLFAPPARDSLRAGSVFSFNRHSPNGPLKVDRTFKIASILAMASSFASCQSYKPISHPRLLALLHSPWHIHQQILTPSETCPQSDHFYLQIYLCSLVVFSYLLLDLSASTSVNPFLSPSPPSPCC